MFVGFMGLTGFVWFMCFVGFIGLMGFRGLIGFMGFHRGAYGLVIWFRFQGSGFRVQGLVPLLEHATVNPKPYRLHYSECPHVDKP